MSTASARNGTTEVAMSSMLRPRCGPSNGASDSRQNGRSGAMTTA